MSEYKKDRYSFSLAPALVLVSKEIVEERSREANQLITELEEYGIILKDLAAEEISYELRNQLVNIAMFISEDTEIYNKLYEKKELPIAKLSKAVLKSKQFLYKWREYIIAYTLILGSYKYKHISDYLKIIEEKDEAKEGKDSKVINFNNISSFNGEEYTNDENAEEDRKEEQAILCEEIGALKGIIVYKRKTKAIILTSSGEFLKVKVKYEEMGSEVTSKVKTQRKNMKFYIAILAILLISGLSIMTYKYLSGVSTIIFETDEQVTLEVNGFNRVIKINSRIESDLDNLKIQDKNIDTAIYKLIEYCKEEDKLSKNQVSITVTGKSIKHGVLAETSKYISEEGINVKFNNAGYESSLK